MKLQNRVAVVTGAAQGLGRAIAQRLAADGAKVVVADIDDAASADTVSAIAAAGGEAIAVHCDVSSSAEVDALFAATDARFGTVHILVNNAALFAIRPEDEERRKRHYALLTQPIPRQSLGITRDMSDADWKRFWAVNVDGVFYCTRAALRRMELQNYGRIVNIASIAGISPLSAHSPHYSATKGAVIAFTRSVAYEVAGANVQVNAVCPGGVLTPPMEDFLSRQSSEAINQLNQVLPLGRMGRPEEYAATVAHLVSDECYMVGAILNVSGGTVIA